MSTDLLRELRRSIGIGPRKAASAEERRERARAYQRKLRENPTEEQIAKHREQARKSAAKKYAKAKANEERLTALESAVKKWTDILTYQRSAGLLFTDKTLQDLLDDFTTTNRDNPTTDNNLQP
jgi:hypothetical protein